MVRSLCIEALLTWHLPEKETVFQAGQAQLSAIFVEKGRLDYRLSFRPRVEPPQRPSWIQRARSKSIALHFLHRGTLQTGATPAALQEGTVYGLEWFCDQSLWTRWTTVGHLKSEESVRLVVLEAQSFSSAICSVPVAKFQASIYARVACRSIRNQGENCTDRSLFVELE